SPKLHYSSPNLCKNEKNENKKRQVVFFCITGYASDEINEIGAIELINKEETGIQFHILLKSLYFKFSLTHSCVHGLINSKNREKVLENFKKFIVGSSLVVHDEKV